MSLWWSLRQDVSGLAWLSEAPKEKFVGVLLAASKADRSTKFGTLGTGCYVLVNTTSSSCLRRFKNCHDFRTLMEESHARWQHTSCQSWSQSLPMSCDTVQESFEMQCNQVHIRRWRDAVNLSPGVRCVYSSTKGKNRIAKSQITFCQALSSCTLKSL